MFLDFQFTKRGNDLVLITGVSITKLQEYEREYNYLMAYKRDGVDFIIPQSKIIDVIDKCFDHFTEESLMRVSGFIERTDTETREKINERSVSKKRNSKAERREQELKEREKKEREQKEREQKEREQKEREQKEREREQREREQREREREREQKERELKEKEREKEREKKRAIVRDLNYEEPSSKTELLKMVSAMKAQIEIMERYIHKM